MSRMTMAGWSGWGRGVKADLIIVAAGQATRLGDLCANVPKCLLSFGGKPAIERMLDKLPMKDFRRIICVLSPDFRGDLLKRYLLANRYRVTFVEQPRPEGTADAVIRALRVCRDDPLPVLIMWSDIIPQDRIELPEVDTVFTSADFSCRYGFKDGNVVPMENGNVIGMYYLTDPVAAMDRMMFCRGDEDFADTLPDWLEERGIKCLDFGVQETFDKTSQVFQTSAWATLRRDGKCIVKQYRPEALHLFQREYVWYRHLPESFKDCVPKLYSASEEDLTLVLQFLNARDPGDVEEVRELVRDAITALSARLHSHTYPADRDSLHTEYVKMPLERAWPIVNMVDGLNRPFLKINGKMYANPLTYLKDPESVDRMLTFLMPGVFGRIHGDPTLQNMMWDGFGTRFIDPNAKFGSLWLFGDPKYDWAKLYYSLVGNYDGFNRGGYWLRAERAGFEYAVSEAPWASLGPWYLSFLETWLGVGPAQIKLIHALIWLRLTGYIQPKSLEQAIVAFLHAAVLLSEVVEEVGWSGSRAS